MPFIDMLRYVGGKHALDFNRYRIVSHFTFFPPRTFQKFVCEGTLANFGRCEPAEEVVLDRCGRAHLVILNTNVIKS